MEMESLKELYVDELKDLWSAENQITQGAAEDDQGSHEPEAQEGVQHAPQADRAPREAARAHLQGARREPAREEMRRHGRTDQGRRRS